MQEQACLIQELEAAIAEGTSDRRLNALTRITDLFIAGSGRHSNDLIVLFDDVLTRLAATIEVKARAQLARRLAPCKDCPPKVARSLAFDDAIAVAGPVLSRSPQLCETDLVTVVNTKTQGHLEAVTQRESLSEAVTDALIACGNDKVVQRVVKNSGARFSDDGFGKLVRKATKDESLARDMGARRDIPRDHFLKLLEAASSKVRSDLAALNPKLAEEIKIAVAGIAADINLEMRNASQSHRRARDRVKRLRRTGQFSEADLHLFAYGNDFERAAIALSAIGDFPIDLVERALVDPSPDLILVLGKAAQCCRATVRSLLMMRCAGRKMSGPQLETVLTHFERLKVKTARATLEFYRLRLETDETAPVPRDLTLAWYAEALPTPRARASA